MRHQNLWKQDGSSRSEKQRNSMWLCGNCHFKYSHAGSRYDHLELRTTSTYYLQVMSRGERTMNNRAGSRVVARFPTVAEGAAEWPFRGTSPEKRNILCPRASTILPDFQTTIAMVARNQPADLTAHPTRNQSLSHPKRTLAHAGESWRHRESDRS